MSASEKRYLGVTYRINNIPELDPDFIPMGKWMRAYLTEADHPVRIGIERQGKITVRETRIYGTEEMIDADYRYLERYIKFLLWSIGGYRIYISGADKIACRLRNEYVYSPEDESKNGKRWFDVQFMEDVFGRTIEIITVPFEEFPEDNDQSVSVGGHFEGNRIGLDLGGSDLKISLVSEGKELFTDEVIWHPKQQSDPAYHYDFLKRILQSCEEKLGHVDAIGISSAGVLLGNAPMVSSLFIKVPREPQIRKEVHTIFDRVAATVGDGTVPVIVANDGDVTALAGALTYQVNNVLGLAFGTSVAGGFVDRKGNILGWFNELAFAPVDLNENAPLDEWSKDIGVGCKYLSQDAVMILAERAGIALDGSKTVAERLTDVQKLAESGDVRAERVFRTIGCYLAHSIEIYRMLYDFDHLMLLGRVLSGISGEIILNECVRILKEEYPDLSDSINLILPDEKTRKVGQAYAAASLPVLMI